MVVCSWLFGTVRVVLVFAYISMRSSCCVSLHPPNHSCSRFSKIGLVRVVPVFVLKKWLYFDVGFVPIKVSIHYWCVYIVDWCGEER